MVMLIKVYLAGDISRVDRWRSRVMKACRDLPIEWYCPVDTIDYRPKQLAKANAQNLVFLDCDLAKVDKADVVFAYIRECDSRHSGTSAEIGYAYKAGKMVILVNDMQSDLECKYGFIKRLVGYRYFRSLTRGIDFLQEFVAEMHYRPQE